MTMKLQRGLQYVTINLILILVRVLSYNYIFTKVDDCMKKITQNLINIKYKDKARNMINIGK